jgi:hypothetical protein
MNALSYFKGPGSFLPFWGNNLWEPNWEGATYWVVTAISMCLPKSEAEGRAFLFE